MQRVMQLDVEAIRRSLEERIRATYMDGAVGITMDGYSYRIGHDDHGPVITTVLSKETGHPRYRAVKDE